MAFPLLYSLHIRDYVVKFYLHSVYMFAVDTTIVGRISKNDEKRTGRRWRAVAWYQDDNLSLNISRTRSWSSTSGNRVYQCCLYQCC